MARRNQNTFLKRQKEIERMRKAKEKMDRRHGKKRREEEPAGFALSGEPPQDHDGATLSEETSLHSNGESAADDSPDH